MSSVVCVDIDRAKLRMAANNASIYGVDPSRILFVEGNAVEVLALYKDGKMSDSSKSKDINTPDAVNATKEICKGYTICGYDLLPSNIDCVFLSPPWGGMDYLKAGNSGYELSKCIKVNGADPSNDKSGCDGDELLSLSAIAAKNKSVVYFLPKNVNGFNIGMSAWNVGYRKGIEMEQNMLNGKLKTVTVYLTEY